MLYFPIGSYIIFMDNNSSANSTVQTSTIDLTPYMTLDNFLAGFMVVFILTWITTR